MQKKTVSLAETARAYVARTALASVDADIEFLRASKIALAAPPPAPKARKNDGFRFPWDARDLVAAYGE